uniref:Uncharacterized protein n=1 Tax=Leptobrachium leishanense TaxID=445787 RepID=A0A8C5QEF8_9ANUR
MSIKGLMAERDCKTHKHKWSGPSEKSPSKYLKGTTSRLPREVRYTKGDVSESLYMTSERLLAFSECVAGDPKRARTRTSIDAKTRFKKSQTSDTDQLETSTDSPTGASDAFRREDFWAARSPDINEDLECDGPSCRTPRAHDPTMIFKRAFHDIIGTSLRRKPLVSRSHEQSTDGEHERSAGESHHRRSAPAADIGKRGEHLSADQVQINALAGFSGSSEIAVSWSDKSEADDHEKNNRLVFLCEDDSDEDPYLGNVMEKNPSIGSDFSDVDDVSCLARFSQDDPVVSCCSLPDEPPFRSRDLSPEYSDQYTSSLASRSFSDEGTWLQKELKSNQKSEHYTDWLENSHLDVSHNGESPADGRWQRSGSFCSTSTSTSVSQRRKSDSLVCSPFAEYLDGGFIDTHCHLDMLFDKLSFEGSFAEFRRDFSSTFPHEFQGCITDFCNPDTLQNLPWQQLLDEDMVWGAFGCHPHFAQYFTDQKQDLIMKALRHPKAVAYGEMGLDYSHKCSTEIPVQHKVFEDQLKKAVLLGKPLVIHCRDADEDLFRIMKKLVPTDYRIHRHCFTGTYAQIEPFLNEFPNLAVGFTALVTYSSAIAAKDAMKRIPLERLIVETDAPYFLPRQVPKVWCKFSHPGLAFHTVQEMAKLRNISVKSVLSTLRRNTNRLYNL